MFIISSGSSWVERYFMMLVGWTKPILNGLSKPNNGEFRPNNKVETLNDQPVSINLPLG